VSTNGSPNSQPRITLYTTQTCHWCRVAKAYLAERGLVYREFDVGHDASAKRRMLLMTGQHGVPVIEVGEHAMIGWDRHEFEKLLSGKFKRR